MANFVIVDLECTCGWHKENRRMEIIEIGAVKYNNKLEIVDEFQSFVRPILNPELTDFCKDLTTITQADVDNADTFQHVFHDFHDWCLGSRYEKQNDVWLCSWGHFDRSQFRKDCELWNIENIKWIDRHISIKHQHGTIIGVKNGIGMTKALEMLDIPMDGTHHRGISDARNIGKIFVKLFPHLKFD